MRTNRILVWGLTCFTVLAATSCGKYLDKKSDSALVVPKSLADLQGLLNDYNLMNENTPALGEASADDYFVAGDVYDSYEEELRLAYTWKMPDYNFPNDWANGYTAVYNANYCLEQLEKIERAASNTASWDNVRGAALFYRCYYFLSLAWDFAKAYDAATAATDLGIVLRLGSDYNAPSVRSSVLETYLRVTGDLREAASLLPDSPPLHTAQPSKAAAYGALARAFLTMREYDSAARYAGLALRIKNDLLDYNDGSVTPSADVPFKPFNSEIIFYSTQWYNYRSKNPDNGLVDSVLVGSYEADDLRKAVFFRKEGGYARFKGSYASDQTLLFTGIATDELVLIKAECDVRAGRVVEALAGLNGLLSKRWQAGRFTPLAITDPVALTGRVLSERRKELLFRGLRWADIKRLNKEGSEITLERVAGGSIHRLQPNSPAYALPLPKDIIDQTGIPQN